MQSKCVDPVSLMESLAWYRQHLTQSLINIENLIAEHAKAHQTARLLEDLQHLLRVVSQIEVVDNTFHMAAEIDEGAQMPSTDIPSAIERAHG